MNATSSAMQMQDRATIRSALLSAAKDAIRVDGIDGMNLRQIALQCGTSTQSIYTIFGGKEGLVATVFRYLVENFAQAIADALAKGAGPAERLRAVGRMHRQLAKSDPALFLALTQSKTNEGNSQLALLRQSLAATRFAETVRDGQRLGIFRPDIDPIETFEAMCSAGHGLVVFELCGFFQTDAEAEARLETLMDLMVKGIS
jgi:AcrR family transcriptional regulator